MISIIDMTRGQVKFIYNDREGRILGEMLIREIGGLDYILYENSFSKWNPPFEADSIDPSTKFKVLKELLDALKLKIIKVEIK